MRPRGDRRGNIRHLKVCHESYKPSQNFNWEKKKNKPTTQPQKASFMCWMKTQSSKEKKLGKKKPSDKILIIFAVNQEQFWVALNFVPLGLIQNEAIT